MGLANYITLSRVFLSPIFLLLYLYHTQLGISDKCLPYCLLVLLGLTELSDAVDGYLARKFNQVSDFGKIFDPIADSLSRITVFLTFTLPPVNLPLLLVLIFLYRDSVTNTLRMACALKGIALGARTSGKVKAIIQAIACFCILLLMILMSLGYISNEGLTHYASWITGIAAIYSLLSGIDYLYANGHYIVNMMDRSRPSEQEP